MTGRLGVKVHAHTVMVGHLQEVWCPSHHALLDGHDVAQSAILSSFLKRSVPADLTKDETVEACRRTLRRHVCCLIGDAALKEVVATCQA